jgi:hypothetical protein
VGVDADEINPQMLMSGDHNIGSGTANNNSVAPVATAIWGNGAAARLASSTGNLTVTNKATALAAWGDNQHQKQGNIGLSDGSAQQVTIAKLREALANTGDTANPHNRLAFP